MTSILLKPLHTIFKDIHKLHLRDVFHQAFAVTLRMSHAAINLSRSVCDAFYSVYRSIWIIRHIECYISFKINILCSDLAIIRQFFNHGIRSIKSSFSVRKGTINFLFFMPLSQGLLSDFTCT